jgi:ubiquinone/menaquinone biosynthesis C-methylase UbiE
MPLDAAAARRVYDRIGRLQDSQRLYEDAATRRLAELADFDDCGSVFELGCGTGRYAAYLLATRLPATATYVGVDVSPRMVALTRERLGRWSPRARVELLESPALKVPAEDRAFDRFVSTYVFDLLSPDDARALVGEAARVLVSGGLLALVSLTHGTTSSSRIFSTGWKAIAERWPSLLGGCQPIDLRELIAGPAWSIVRCEVVLRFAVPSQVLIATRQAQV